MPMLDVLKKTINYLYLHLWKYRHIDIVHGKRIKMVAERGQARVVIFAMNVPMWKYGHLYELLRRDSRFKTWVVISPSISYRLEQQINDVKSLRTYFNAQGVPFIDCDVEGDSAPFDVKKELDPDVIFYPQPYEHLLAKKHDCLNFYDRLICYYPYAFMTGKGKFSYNFHFHNLAWRLYYSNNEILKEAQKTAWNQGRNVRIVGYPMTDDYCKSSHINTWKKINDGKKRKRVIWAPHFSFDDKFGQLPRGNFLWMADFMVEVAKKYKALIQFTFKPHPRLLTELYDHPEWGKSKTDAYYKLWAEMENTQVEMGDYVDLFMTSDGMVHDSGSFVIEYNYTNKPVMFVSRDIEKFLTGQTNFSKEAFKVLLIGKNEKEILNFLESAILNGQDEMSSLRKNFCNRYLNPPNNKSVAQNTLDDLVSSLGLKK